MNEWTAFHDFHAEKIELVAGIDCWIWTGCAHPGGHGRVSSRSGYNYAHRAAYDAYYGDLRPDLVVRHLCGCSSCVRPGHLKMGTAADNAKDTADMGRTPTHLRYNDVREIRKLYNEGIPLAEIASRFGMAYGSVYPIVIYKSFRHVDPHLKGQHKRRVANFIDDKQIAEARELISQGLRNCDIARQLGIRPNVVSNIRRGARYAHR